MRSSSFNTNNTIKMFALISLVTRSASVPTESEYNLFIFSIFLNLVLCGEISFVRTVRQKYLLRSGRYGKIWWPGKPTWLPSDHAVLLFYGCRSGKMSVASSGLMQKFAELRGSCQVSTCTYRVTGIYTHGNIPHLILILQRN